MSDEIEPDYCPHCGEPCPAYQAVERSEADARAAASQAAHARELAEAQCRNATLEAALKPFAESGALLYVEPGTALPHPWKSAEHMRAAARAALGLPVGGGS